MLLFHSCHQWVHDTTPLKMRQKGLMLIGEALATGRPAEPPADPFHGLTASQMESMTLKEV